MTARTEKILDCILLCLFSIYATIKMLIILFFLSICIPTVGWWFFSHIFAPYFGYYDHYWEFIPLPAIAIFAFLIFFFLDKIMDD